MKNFEGFVALVKFYLNNGIFVTESCSRLRSNRAIHLTICNTIAYELRFRKLKRTMVCDSHVNPDERLANTMVNASTKLKSQGIAQTYLETYISLTVNMRGKDL